MSRRLFWFGYVFCLDGELHFFAEKADFSHQGWYETLFDLDSGKHVIPMMLAAGDRVFAYNFNDNLIPGMTPEEKGYWKDVGTLDSILRPTWI